MKILTGLAAALVALSTVWMAQWAARPEMAPLLAQDLRPDAEVAEDAGARRSETRAGGAAAALRRVEDVEAAPGAAEIEDDAAALGRDPLHRAMQQRARVARRVAEDVAGQVLEMGADQGRLGPGHVAQRAVERQDSVRPRHALAPHHHAVEQHVAERHAEPVGHRGRVARRPRLRVQVQLAHLALAEFGQGGGVAAAEGDISDGGGQIVDGGLGVEPGDVRNLRLVHFIRAAARRLRDGRTPRRRHGTAVVVRAATRPARR